jgi:hypothetical protein
MSLGVAAHRGEWAKYDQRGQMGPDAMTYLFPIPQVSSFQKACVAAGLPSRQQVGTRSKWSNLIRYTRLAHMATGVVWRLWRSRSGWLPRTILTREQAMQKVCRMLK